MNPDYDKMLEKRVDEVLRGLPELRAPATLSARVMAVISQRASVPWYRQSWELWPPALRISSMAILLVMFGGLCFASWELSRAAGTSAVVQELGGLFSGVAALWKTAGVLLNSVVLVLKHLGTTFILALLAVVALGYATCVGLGTLYFRVAFARTN